MKNLKFNSVIFFSVLIIITGFYALNNYIYKEKQGDTTTKYPNTQNEYVSYKNSEHSPEFIYPKSWGEITIKEGNKVCPEEDTYRTADTLSVFDWEFSIPEIDIPDSESFVRTGVRIYELDPKKLNDCGDDFLYKIATKEIVPEILSSVILSSFINQNGLSGMYNPRANRLDTEARIQYTFFSKSETSEVIYVIQSYFNFIPYYGSPELTEIEGQFANDINKYLTEGETAENIRQHLEEFIKMSESIKFSGE